ncbi:lasso peptide isopeptide bond-forming cyclase [Sporosarcina sp. G11-34]|uniref:lasso peptide isopeptide bond-forming cyclase n=1 Tax=Sporosarcina sp. G11-34 TaxID=2849605 RepID=UPI0022A919DA|nr:lasso peptide isopeptide bond-forming cyclase [Sporosarcina sp. G11-34]MCZ2257313.1 lasso peptide isopeptide bond-forming cyclase [Sporosarcina sp. G11-34]
MSAITGIYHLNGEPINIQYGRDLMKALQKYPSDAIQTWHTDQIFLGCHAQWITPESVGEQLPFYDYERQCAITSDALIDNRKELFERLRIEPSVQKHITDSELILRAYYKWQDDAPKFLVGDFAFMIWDQKKQRLFGARDFSGSRTLYYYKNHEKFAFCTIIEPLLSLPYIEKKLNEQWLAEYLALPGMVDAIDASSTPYKNIGQVPPSHSISVEKNKVTVKRYSYITQGKRLKLKSNEEYVEAFQDVFREAVSCRLRTHRNVGSQLSGGLDSGAVVGFAAKHLQMGKKRLHTFSSIPAHDFKDFSPNYLLADETPYIQSTAKYVGGITEHYCSFEGKDSYSEMNDFLNIMEMPYKFFENSFWLKGIFEKAQEEDIGVLLSGDRGNFSISWGDAYDYYSLLLKKLRWVHLYQELDYFNEKVGGSRSRKLRIIARSGFPILDRIFPQEIAYKLPSLINPEFAKQTGVYSKFKEQGINQDGLYTNTDIFGIRKKHFEDVFHWNASSTLATKLSLRHSVWKRDPTNDIRVIRFCLSLPEGQYVQKGMDRALVRRATKNYLPDNVRLNQQIHGVQGADWVHRMMPNWEGFTDELQKMSKDNYVMELLNPPVIKAALEKVKQTPRPEYAIDPDYKILMRSLIVYRFIKKFL